MVNVYKGRRQKRGIQQGVYKTKPTKFQDFSRISRSFLNSFPVCLHKMSTPNKFVHTKIIWNVQFHLAYFYLTTFLLTLTEAAIYWAGSLLPEILLTVQILSTQLQILSTQSTKYRQMSTNIDFNVIFPGFSTEFQGFYSRILLNSRVFPGYPGFPGSVDTSHPALTFDR